MITEEIKQNIIKELGMENIPMQKVEKVMQTLEENIQRTLVLEILNLLDSEDQKELNKILESEDSVKITEFLQGKVTNLNSLIEKVAKSVVTEFKNFGK